MNRREFMLCAAVLASQSSLASVHKHLSPEQKDYLANGKNFNDWHSDVFTPKEKAMIAIISDHIVPRTDTPGALDAGVPQFIERMAEEWFNQQERQIFFEGLKHLEKISVETFSHSFIDLSNNQQLQLLEHLEEQASEHPWYKYGNVMRDFISDAPFICQIKELTLWGFFTSEVGGTQVLRNSPMGNFNGDIELKESDSSWNDLQF